MNDYNNSSNHISKSILIQYHKMGFKLIPIGDDGVTPNVSGLLTPEEQCNKYTRIEKWKRRTSELYLSPSRILE